MNGNDAAFPRPPAEFTSAGANMYPPQMGMSLRIYLAAAAMTGILASPNAGNESWNDLAVQALNAADALIRMTEQNPLPPHKT